MTSGTGEPRAAHSTTAPVVLLKSTRFGGSFMNIGPMVSSSHDTDPGNKQTRLSNTLVRLKAYATSLNIWNV